MDKITVLPGAGSERHVQKKMEKGKTSISFESKGYVRPEGKREKKKMETTRKGKGKGSRVEEVLERRTHQEPEGSSVLSPGFHSLGTQKGRFTAASDKKLSAWTEGNGDRARKECCSHGKGGTMLAICNSIRRKKEKGPSKQFLR